MKKLILILLLFSTSLAINPLPMTADKQIHTFVSYTITDFFETNGCSPLDSLIFLLIISEIKEEVDVALGGSRDNNDINANLLGYGMYRIVHIEF